MSSRRPGPPVRVGVDTWVVGSPGALVVDGTTLSPALFRSRHWRSGDAGRGDEHPGWGRRQRRAGRRHNVGAAGRRGERDRLAATETPPIRSASQVSTTSRPAEPASPPRSPVSEIPSDLYYTEDHEWVRRTGDDTVRVGITDYAQAALGDVVFVELPDVDAEVTAGSEFGTVESTKSNSDLYAPITAKVVAVNGELADSPGAGQLRPVRRPDGSSTCRSTPRRCPRRWTVCSTPTPTARPSTNENSGGDPVVLDTATTRSRGTVVSRRMTRRRPS